MRRVRRLRGIVAFDTFTTVEAALGILIVGPIVVVGLLLAAAPTRSVTWSLLAIGSVAVTVAALVLPVVSLLHACRDCFRLARSKGRLPRTTSGYVRAAWRWLETATALSFVGTGLFAIRVVTRAGNVSGDAAPLPGWSTVFVLVPFLVAVVLATMILLRVTVTVGQRFRNGAVA